MIELAVPGVRVFVVESRVDADSLIAREVEDLVRRAPRAVLGLATGTSPIGVYDELARSVRELRMSLRSASSFNLDEYLDVPREHPSSFRSWMKARLFDHVDLPLSRAHFPALERDDEAHDAACERFERALRDAGGVDLQLLGIGRNGHIAFNEPGTSRDSRTRAVELHAWTRADAASAFGGLARVPTRALTMGVATILEARAIRVMAFGASKAGVVAAALEGEIGPECPATYLRGHRDARVYLDAAASSALRAGRVSARP